MYPHLFGIKFINMYGLCIGIGIIACLAFLKYACKKLDIPSKFEDFVEWNALLAILLGFGSAALFQSVYDFIENPSAGFHFGTEGLTFMGGLIGGVASFLLVYFLYGRKKYGNHLLELLPIAACCILVAHAFGRIGCVCAGCCWGKEVPPHTLFAMQMPRRKDLGSYNSPADWPWLYPTQIFESAFLFLDFGICAYLTVNKKFKYTMNVYLISYGIFRFLNEFLRDDDRGSFIPGISPSQFWCIIMVIAGIALCFIMPKLYKKFEKQKSLELETADGVDNSEVVTLEEENTPIEEVTVDEKINENNNKKEK